ncbi:hypothetical protein Tco_0699205 [Tanacetum coccineum]
MKYHPQTNVLLRHNLGVLQIGIKSQGYREPDFVMSDSEHSTVTYTEDPYVEAALQAPPSPDYVMGPEYPPSTDFVSEPVYPEFMPSVDEEDLGEDPKEDPADYPTD